MRASPLLVILLLLSTAGLAAAATVGIGAFGGTSVPIIQEDTGGGSMFGARVPINLVSILTVEPYYATSSLGTKTQTVDGVNYTRTGFDVKSYGANVILGTITGGAGFKFFPFAGIGQNKLTRVGSDDISEVGYTFGLGIGVAPTDAISVIARGEINAVQEPKILTTNDSTRKFANVTVGLSYNLFRSK
jgi:opacity protein-like surface antigen